MNGLLLNLILAFVWMAMTADFSFLSFMTGAVLGFAALWISAPLTGIDALYFKRLRRISYLAGFFLWELVLSSISVAWDVIRLVPQNKPALIEVPLTVKGDFEILLLTNLISLTPGTLSVDVTEDRETLIVHAMFGDDPDALIADIKDGFERLIMGVFET
ncbi:MAG: Na+/H+ antiporter subunit E [Roseinatronobacter sp.]